MYTHNTNDDGMISSLDLINEDEFDVMIKNCDMNGDSYISECEVFDCMIIVENHWRDANCPKCDERIASCEE